MRSKKTKAEEKSLPKVKERHEKVATGSEESKSRTKPKSRAGREIPSDGRYVFTSADGVVLCELRVSVTADTGDGRAHARAKKLEDAYRAGALLLARDRLFSEAEEEYRKSDDPRKRFTARRYIVTLEGVRLPAPDGILSMRFRLTVARGGKELTALTRGAVIDSRGRLCPHTHFTASPGSIKMQFSKRKNAKKFPRRISTWYIDGDFAVLVPKGGGKDSSEYAKVPIETKQTVLTGGKKSKRSNC